eukprot:346372-Prorocentrum_minimum.AAC.1
MDSSCGCRHPRAEAEPPMCCRARLGGERAMAAAPALGREGGGGGARGKGGSVEVRRRLRATNYNLGAGRAQQGSMDQSDEGRGYTPIGWTNRIRGEGITVRTRREAARGGRTRSVRKSLFGRVGAVSMTRACRSRRSAVGSWEEGGARGGRTRRVGTLVKANKPVGRARRRHTDIRRLCGIGGNIESPSRE